MTVDASQPQVCPVAHDFDPLGADYLSDPYRPLESLRAESPVHYVPSLGYWLVTRYADIAGVFADRETFSERIAQEPLAPLSEEARQILTEGVRNTPVLTNFGAPGHTRVRLRLARPFLPRRVEQLRPLIEQRAEELIDKFASNGSADLVEALTFPLPALTVFGLIGFPAEDADQLKSWCDNKLEVNWGRPSPEYQQRAATNMSLFWDYCERFVVTRLSDPADDLTSELIRQRETDEDALDDREITSVIFALSFAGHETTTNLIGNTLRQLLSRPELLLAIQADPSVIDRAVEETLRFDSSVVAWRRITTKPTTIGGVEVPEGAKLMLSLASANRDPEQFTDPETFDIGRKNSRTHLSFGKGAHFCMGQHLARVEARVVIEMLVSRLPGLRLSDEQQWSFPPNISFRGPKKLQVEWDAN